VRLQIASPQAGPHASAEPGVLLSSWPLRSRGGRIAVTRANRDYPGGIRAIGPGPAAVEITEPGQ
jgi:hypothetical protein